MNTLQKLWKSVQTFSYPLRATDSYRPSESLKRHDHNDYHAAALEAMEPRLLLTTLTSGDAPLQYIDSAGTTCTATISGGGTAQLIFINSAGKLCNYVDPTITAADDKGMDLYAVIFTSSTINTVFTVDGIYTGTDGKLAGGLYGNAKDLWGGITDSDLYPIAGPDHAGVVYIGSRIQGDPITNAPRITVADTALSATPGEVLDSDAIDALNAAKGLLTGLSITHSTYSNSEYTAGIYVLPDDSTGDPQTIGKILIDGTVTGNVYVSGSIDTFYCGWLLTGDAVGQTFKNDNFYVGGDIAHLLVNTSVGFGDKGGTTTVVMNQDTPYYNTHVDIHVGGHIGNIHVGGVFMATTTVDNNADAPGLDVNPSTVYNQSEIGEWLYENNLANKADAFRSGVLPLNDNATMSNGSASNPDYIGVVDSGNTAQVSGQLQNFMAAKNANDFYAVGLTAGQTITINFTDIDTGDLSWGILDSQNRIVAITHGSRSLNFKATASGVYRIAIGLEGDSQFTGSADPVSLSRYKFTVKGLGSADSGMAIGGITSGADMVFDKDVVYVPNPVTHNLDRILLSNGLTVTRGDIGAIVCGGAMHGYNTAGTFTFGTKTASITESSITVSRGNIAALIGGTIGELGPGDVVDYGVGLTVQGTIGLISATGNFLGAYAVSSGNIQTIDGKGEVAGMYATKKGIGVIRAGEMLLGNTQTIFSADYDNTGRDGIIDLIDVTGDLGSINHGGPRIITGIGGNVRFIHISDSSFIYQDRYWTGGDADLRGGISYTGGEPIAPFIDDSGAKITLSLTGASTDPDTTVLTVWSYGIFGTGGAVLVRIESSASLTVSATSDSSNLVQSAEIGEIVMQGTGTALVDGANGVKVNPATASTTDNNLTLSAGFRMDVFKVSSTGGVINNIVNGTGGDIVNISAGDVGAISVRGNLGLTSNNTGVVLDQTATIPGTSDSFPFYNLHNGIVAGNIGSISAGKAIGAIIASGSVGTIRADADEINDPTIFEGLVAPIVISGSVNSIMIGEGVTANGVASYPTGGIYVGGTIYSVSGTDADIRGNIISKEKIGSISLTNGSLVGMTVGVYSDFKMAWDYIDKVTLPEVSDTANNPKYEIGSITINGNGGILGCLIEAADIGFVTVGNNGFGILNTYFITLANGVIGGLTAGGLGFVDVTTTGYRVGYMKATGDGSTFDINNYSSSVRLSEQYDVDPFTGQIIADENPDLHNGFRATDLSLFVSGIKSTFGITNLNTGMIFWSALKGSYGIGSIVAYSIQGQTSFDFAIAIGPITVATDIVDSTFLSGSIGAVTVKGNVTNSSLQAAGKITSVTIDGNMDATSLIYGKGSSSSIGSVTVKGDFAGTLVSAGDVSTLNVGDAKTGNSTFSGTIRLLGRKAAGNVNFYGTVSGGSVIEIDGDVSGTLRFSKGFDGDLTINGNVAAITITPDSGSFTGMTGDISVNGNLKSMTVTGAMSLTSTLTIQGDLGSFVINDNDTQTDGDLLAGKIIVGGVITGVTINGDSTQGGSLTGTIQAAKAIGTITVNNGDVASGAVIKSLMAGIAKITVNNGILDGTVDADGAIGVIELKLPSGKVTARVNGSIGADADISGASLATLTVPGDIAAGAAIALTGALGTTAIKGDIADGATISAASIGKSFTVTGNMNGDMTLTQIGAVSTITINGTFGDSGSTATLSVAGSLKLNVNGIFDSTSVLRVGGNLVSLIAKNAADGTIIVNGTITALSAASMTGAVVTAGVNIDKLTVTGALDNSLVQAGIKSISNGADGNFFTDDDVFTTSMGAIGAISVGSLTNSVIAAGGMINSLTSKGVMTGSSASSGLVYDGAKIASVVDGTNTLDDAGVIAVRVGGTLYHGNFNTVSINGGKADGLINSALTAGISAGANGTFEAGDNTDAPGMSTFKSVKALMPILGNTSVILAETTTAAKAVNGGMVTGSATHTPATTGTEVPPTSHVGNKYVFTIDGEIVTITVSTGVTVKAYDDGATVGVLDSLLISSTSAAAGSVKVVATNPDALSIGQVLTDDDVNLGTFTFNGDIVGVTGKPAVQIDSNMTTFSVRNLLNSDTTSVIGGDVASLTIGEMADGTLTIAGAVKSLKVTTNTQVGNFVANSFGTITLGLATSTSDYLGTFTALLGGTVNSIGSVVINGTGKFSGVITAAGSVGTISAAKANFEDATISVAGDVKSITLTAGKMDITSTITVGGTLGALSIKGDLEGTVHANSAGTITVSGDLAITSGTPDVPAVIQIDNAATKITIGGNVDGTLTAGAIGTLAITGTVNDTSNIRVAGDVGSLTVSGGTETGSYIFVDGTITALKVTGTHAGTIATGIGGNVGTATFATVSSGALVVAGDLTKLIVTGNATSSLFSAGVYIGVNGLYNDADDVVYGGKIGSASFSGTYRDSVLAAGVLPRLSGSTGIPADGRDYTGNFVSTANGVAYTDDPSTTGGITMSTIGKITFSKKVESSNADGGHMAVVVAADDITPITYKGTLFSRIIGNPSEPLTVKSTTLADTNKIEVVFTQPVDFSTISNKTVTVNHSAGSGGAAYTPGDLSYSYSTRTATDGTLEYVVTITLATGTFNTSTVAGDEDTVTLLGGTSGVAGDYITNQVGSRSAKITELGYIPFGTAGFPSVTNTVTVPVQS